MWNSITPEKLSKLVPALYSTEKIPLAEKIITAHFFIGSADWFIVEYDQEEDLAFGYANLGDDEMAEWGYISIDELRSVKVKNVFEVEYDGHWIPKPAKDIKKIILR